MRIFSKIKMKYRMLLVVLFPIVILMGFMADFIKKEYKDIQLADDIQIIMKFTSKLTLLTQELQAEAGVSKLTLQFEASEISKEISNQRQKVDSALQGLKDVLESYEPSPARQYLAEVAQNTSNKLEVLTQKRMQIDNKEISPLEAYNSIMGLENFVIEEISRLINKFNDAQLVRQFYELIAATQESIAVTNIRQIVLEALLTNKMTAESFSSLEREVGKQLEAQKLYDYIAPPAEDELYSRALNKPDINDANRLIEIVTTKNIAGNFGIDPMTWWRKQTARIDGLQELAATIINNNKAELIHRQEMLQKNLHLTLFFSGLILLAVLLTMYYSLKTLAKKLQEEVEVLATSGEEIYRSVSEASSGMTETAAAVTETTTTIEELKQTAQMATDKAKNVSEVSEESLNIIKKSEKSIDDTIQGMNRIHEGMGTISESIIKLSEHSKMIGEIIDTVNDLAEQSHLLAVNAAIEAAKAGDQGKGFAVVAQEVRSLADQSKQATIQVRNILNDIQNATSAAVMATEQGGKAVSQGLNLSAQTNESVKSLSSSITNVAQAASQILLSIQQQLVGVNQVTIAMSNIKTASNQQVDHMRQIESGIQGLNAVGRSLNSQISEYKF